MATMLISSTMTVVYHVLAGIAYACILAVLVLALVFGLRARRNVKKEKVEKLPDGLSPLDIQRIFIGKTFPRRLTRALLVWWAQRGYIAIEQVSRYTVRVRKLKEPPHHAWDNAQFFDRGSYVRERELFRLLIEKASTKKTINVLLPLFTRKEVTDINSNYAVREDEGVYSNRHYRLKVLTLVLSAMPLVMSVVCSCMNGQGFLPVMLLLLATIGYFVLMFVQGAPILFKLLWCGMWLGASLGGIVALGMASYDPLGLSYVGAGMLFVGSFVLVRFVDYREKINLADYSDLINYRKHLLFSSESELSADDYYAALPYIYAFNIKPLVKRKFGAQALPEWYDVGENAKRGALL